MQLSAQVRGHRMASGNGMEGEGEREAGLSLPADTDLIQTSLPHLYVLCVHLPFDENRKKREYSKLSTPFYSEGVSVWMCEHSAPVSAVCLKLIITGSSVYCEERLPPLCETISPIATSNQYFRTFSHIWPITFHFWVDKSNLLITCLNSVNADCFILKMNLMLWCCFSSWLPVCSLLHLVDWCAVQWHMAKIEALCICYGVVWNDWSLKSHKCKYTHRLKWNLSAPLTWRIGDGPNTDLVESGG